MKGSLVKLIIVSVGISLTAASVFTAFTLSTESQVYNFIPGDSTFISHFHYANGSFYVFATNSTYGLITGTPVWQVAGAITSARSNNTTTTNITVTAPLSYRGYTIFEFSGVGLPELMNVLGIKIFSSNFTLPVSNVSIYATELTQKYSVIGSLGGVLSSVNASLHKTGFKTFRNYINENEPLSLAYFAGNSALVSSVSVNITNQDTFVTLSSKNPIPFPPVLNIGNISVGIHNLNNQSITFEIGLGWLQIQAMLGELINSISQNGGLNVKNTTGIPVLL